MEDTQQSNELKIKLESKLKHAQENRELIVKEITERLKEHVSRFESIPNKLLLAKSK